MFRNSENTPNPQKNEHAQPKSRQKVEVERAGRVRVGDLRVIGEVNGCGWSGMWMRLVGPRTVKSPKVYGFFFPCRCDKQCFFFFEKKQSLMVNSVRNNNNRRLTRE